MIFSIVACGQSAKDWIPNGTSIGVNDANKWGKPVDYLVVVNSPIKFHPNKNNGSVDRLKVITSSKPKRFFCHNSNWRSYFPKAELLGMRVFNGSYKPGRVYSSKTSPVVAITLAASLGAKDIILWGVDFTNHYRFQPGKKDYVDEIELYKMLFDELGKAGVKVWLGNDNTSLKQWLPIWKQKVL